MFIENGNFVVVLWFFWRFRFYWNVGVVGYICVDFVYVEGFEKIVFGLCFLIFV